MNKETQQFIEQAEALDAEQLLAGAAERFAGRIALASSFSIEDMVIIDIISKAAPTVGIFTLDTGRLGQQTYDLIEKTRQKYNISIEMLWPNAEALEKMTTELGPNLFYKSIENRKLCCRIRKVEPLKKKLATLGCWITGLRSAQSITRAGLKKCEWDETFGLLKINPLADWSLKQVWDYIRTEDVPYNTLYDVGFKSIGCEPCTRAVKLGEDIRSGRWWWETPEQKECGLHLR